jgi:hypothetical protein
LAEELSTDVLFASVFVAHQTFTCRNNSDAITTKGLGDATGWSVQSSAWFGQSLDSTYGWQLANVLEHHLDLSKWLGLENTHALDVALVNQNLRHALLDFREWQDNFGMASHQSVLQADNHVCYWVGCHIGLFTGLHHAW